VSHWNRPDDESALVARQIRYDPALDYDQTTAALHVLTREIMGHDRQIVGLSMQRILP
jgi:hypothetical protein